MRIVDLERWAQEGQLRADVARAERRRRRVQRRQAGWIVLAGVLAVLVMVALYLIVA